jgi:hypothetical protein
VINLAQDQAVAAADIDRARAAANFFKPARALLNSISFVAAPIVDTAPVPLDLGQAIFKQGNAVPTPIDIVSAPAWLVTDTKTITPLSDAHFYHWD